MIDIHTHILPGLDDGSQTLSDSLEMAELALESGVDTIIATPHSNQLGRFENFDLAEVKKLCENLDVPYHVIDTEIADIIFQVRKEENPCSLCAKMRKGALNTAVKELGCNKVAYAHHRDDIIETMLLSLLFEGRFYAFSPKTFLDRMQLTVIRPMMYVPEVDVIGFRNKYQLPVAKNPCPADGATKREYAKQLVRQLNLENPGVKDRMFHAITNGNIEGWPQKGENR